MGHIAIEGRRIDGLTGLVAGHLYLVYTDDLGNEWIIRGGPENSLAPYGYIRTIGGDQLLSASVDARQAGETPIDRGAIILNLGVRSAEDVWAVLSQASLEIGNANIPYTIDASA